MHRCPSVRFVAVAGLLLAVGLTLALVRAAPAEAHLVGFTCTASQTPGTCGDDLYYCTLSFNQVCWYDGDGSGCIGTNCALNHSYTYQSAKNDLTSDGTVRVIICGASACYNQGATNFVRICLHHHAGWTSDLDCEDQDGYTRQAAIQWGGPSSGTMHGSPWW
jgi:hypothetical protein